MFEDDEDPQRGGLLSVSVTPSKIVVLGDLAGGRWVIDSVAESHLATGKE